MAILDYDMIQSMKIMEKLISKNRKGDATKHLYQKAMFLN